MIEPDNLPELLTVDEAATFLRMTPAALRIAMSRGQIPGIVKLGARVRIRRDDLRAHLGLKKPKVDATKTSPDRS